MKKFILWYEQSNPSGYIDDHRLKALSVLYALAKTCEQKDMRPWKLLCGEDAVCAKIALYAAGGLQVENLLPWQESLKEICQTAVDNLVEKGIFTKKEGFTYLVEPLNKMEFSIADINAIFDEIERIAKEKVDDAIAKIIASD